MWELYQLITDGLEPLETAITSQDESAVTEALEELEVRVIAARLAVGNV